LPVVFWGTLYLERVIQTLQNSDAGVDPDLLQHLSPFGWEHINLTGNYNLAKLGCCGVFGQRN
jgi:hypothetical protein